MNLVKRYSGRYKGLFQPSVSLHVREHLRQSRRRVLGSQFDEALFQPYNRLGKFLFRLLRRVLFSDHVRFGQF